jgi:hypothetical protein
VVNVFYSKKQELNQPALIYIGISNSPSFRRWNILLNTLPDVFPNLNFYVGDANCIEYKLESVPILLFKYNNKISELQSLDFNDIIQFIQRGLND